MKKNIYSSEDFWVQTLELKKLGHHAVVLIIPPTGGTNVLDKKYARYFFKHGLDVVILDHWKDEDEYNLDLEIHNRFYRRGNQALSLIIETLPLHDIYLMGTSVGGIHSVVASVTLPNIKKIFSIVGGISISEIIAKSDQEVLAKGKVERQKMFQFLDDQDYIQRLFNANEYEPERFSYNKAIKTGQILARKDTTVPFYTQENLKQFWETDTSYYMKNNHFWAIVKSYFFYRKRILKFFLN